MKATSILCVLIGAVLLLAAVAKFVSFQMLVATLQELPFLPRAWVMPLAQVVILAEMGIGAALLIPASRRYALPASILLFGAFLAYNLCRIGFHLAAPCPCLPGILRMTPWVAMTIDFVLAGFALMAIRLADIRFVLRPRKTIDHVPSKIS